MSHETNYIAGQRAQKKKRSRRHFFAPHVLECLLDEWHFKHEQKHAEQKTRATKKHAEQKKNLLTPMIFLLAPAKKCNKDVIKNELGNRAGCVFFF